MLLNKETEPNRGIAGTISKLRFSKIMIPTVNVYKYVI